MRAPLLAVDGPFLLYRSYFALPDSITDGEGRPVNALLGAVNLLLWIVEETSPRAVVVCWGAEAARYRVDLYPAYHAHREPAPEPLARQIEAAPELLRAFGWESLDSPDHEADDLLGSLATVEAAAGGVTLIATGDRDMYQCATEQTAVLYLRMGGRGFERVGPEEVRARYGVAPEQVPDFIALRGDPSDGLPGAPGVGPKTAADLLSRHGTLEAAIAAAETERPRISAALSGNAALLAAFKAIATLARLPVERPHDRPVDLAAGARAAAQLGMRRLAERLEQGPTRNATAGGA